MEGSNGVKTLRAVPMQQSTGKWEPQLYNHKQLNSVKSHMNLEEHPTFRMRPQPSPHHDFSLVRL